MVGKRSFAVLFNKLIDLKAVLSEADLLRLGPFEVELLRGEVWMLRKPALGVD